MKKSNTIIKNSSIYNRNNLEIENCLRCFKEIRKNTFIKLYFLKAILSTVFYSMLFIFITISFSYSQNMLPPQIEAKEKPTGYLAITGGASIPVGNFSDSNSIAPAKTGYDFSLIWTIPEYTNMGIYAMLTAHFLPVNEGDIIKQNNSSNYTITSKDWINVSLLSGVYGIFPLDEDIIVFEPKLLIGYVYSALPSYSVSNSQGTEVVSSESAYSSSFGYLVGLGFSFNVSNSVCLLANADYFGSSPDYSFITSSTFAPTVSTNNINIGTINLNFGVGLRL